MECDIRIRGKETCRQTNSQGYTVGEEGKGKDCHVRRQTGTERGEKRGLKRGQRERERERWGRSGI